MSVFSRIDRSVLAQWWWTVDKWLLACLGLVITLGLFLNLAASPAVAETLGLDPYHFFKRHLIVLPVALAILFTASLLTVRQIKVLSFLGFAFALALVGLTLLVGMEIKGAQRWLSLGGFSLQPSELLKPLFAVVIAWCFARSFEKPGFPGQSLAIAVTAVVLSLLILQPDLGMSVVVAATFAGQFFLAGLPMGYVILIIVLGISALLSAYFLLPHVQQRIDLFLNPAAGDSYQIDQSMKAFQRGGVFGVGPGEGTVKSSIPDVHSDFIFAVVGEEYGLFSSLLIVILFAMILMIGFARLLKDRDLFVILAGGGIMMQFGLQALINMGSTLNLIPTKGMTLPFISYGGSSLLALGIGMGIVLALTRRRSGFG